MLNAIRQQSGEENPSWVKLRACLQAGGHPVTVSGFKALLKEWIERIKPECAM
jgi:hypothetical protein